MYRTVGKGVIKILAIVAISGASGIAGAYVCNHRQMQTWSVQVASEIKQSRVAQDVVVSGEGPKWKKNFTPVNQRWIQGVLSSALESSTGQWIPLNPKRPILMTAYWSSYSGETLQLLQANHLLDHVQVVSLGFGRQVSGRLPLPVGSIQQAVSLNMRMLKDANVSMPVSDVLYALPGNQIDARVNEYPLLLVPHGNSWYYFAGFTKTPQVYKNVL